MEAAALLPTLFLLVALAVQPCCLAYTRALMYAAAGEGARVLTTAPAAEREELVSSYVLRRLKAVPNVDAFHMGGSDDWRIEAELSDDGKEATVRIRGHARLVPLVGAAAAALYPSDEVGAIVEVTVSERVRPALEGSFDEWVSSWG